MGDGVYWPPPPTLILGGSMAPARIKAHPQRNQIENKTRSGSTHSHSEEIKPAFQKGGVEKCCVVDRGKKHKQLTPTQQNRFSGAG